MQQAGARVPQAEVPSPAPALGVGRVAGPGRGRAGSRRCGRCWRDPGWGGGAGRGFSLPSGARDRVWADRDPERPGPRIGGTQEHPGDVPSHCPITALVSVSQHRPPRLATGSTSQPAVGSAARPLPLCLSLWAPLARPGTGRHWPQHVRASCGSSAGLCPHHALEGPTGQSRSLLGPAPRSTPTRP